MPSHRPQTSPRSFNTRFLIPAMLMLVCSNQAFADFDTPTGPSTSYDGNYTIFYPWDDVSPYCDFVELQERFNGGGWRWVNDNNYDGAVEFVNKPPGTYEYRAAADCEDPRGEYGWQIHTGSIEVTVFAGPPIEVDDLVTQLGYQFMVQAGELNGDGYTDLYVTRLDGNLDNGVFSETLLQQAADGRFSVLPKDETLYTVARQWNAINVNTHGTDGNVDDFMDLEIWNFPSGTNIQYPQTIYSTGQQYQRNAKSVSTFDESAQMFARDVEAASRDASYFDNAGTPDEPGYRIDLTLEYGYCYFFYWFPICASYRYSIFVGEFSLPELGLSKSSQAGGLQKLAANSSGSSGSGGLISSSKAAMINDIVAQKAATVVDATNTLPSGFIGNSTQKSQASAHFAIQSPWPDTLVCVIWCGFEVFQFYGGYEYFAWYDVWTPTIIEGTFDHANYSQTAFQFVEGEWDWEELMKNGQQAGGRGAMAEAIERIFGILIGIDPEPVEIDTDGTIFDPQTWEDAAKGATIILQRAKNKIMCAFKDDPEECLADIEDDILEDWEGEGPISGVWFPNGFNEDNDFLRDSLPLLGATIMAVSQPGRWQCSYKKKNLAKGLFYYGITSTVASGSCVDAVSKRSRTHDLSARFKAYPGWSQSILDRQTNAGSNFDGGAIIARGIIRGREQQLIDSHVWLYPGRGYTHGLDDKDHMFNRIRSIARETNLGCAAWHTATATLAPPPAGPYTGYSSCPGAPTP